MFLRQTIAMVEQMLLNHFLGYSSTNPDANLRKLLMALIAIFYVMTLGLFFVAAYFALSANFAPSITFTGLAGLALLFGLLNLSILLTLAKIKHKKLVEVNKKIEDMSKKGLAVLDRELADPVRLHPKLSVAASALMGALVGDQLGTEYEARRYQSLNVVKRKI
jgi:hypothetical protein